MVEWFGFGEKKRVSLHIGMSIKQDDCRGYITEHFFKIIFL